MNKTASVSKELFERLLFQSEEAENLGLVRTAESITIQLEKIKARSAKEHYTYSSDQLNQDIHSAMWDAIVRTADFHNHPFDVKEASEIAETFAKDLLLELRSRWNTGAAGAYELPLPGEKNA